MDLPATADKVISLTRILAGRPREFSDRLGGMADMLVDSWQPRRASYEPVGWPTALGELEQIGLAAAATLAEPPLLELEAELRIRLPAIEDRGWSHVYDADPTLARLLYAICRRLLPDVVVETGVAYGMTSAYVLKALEVNRKGTLFSVDLPPLGRKSDELQGSLVPAPLRSRWVLQRGTSRRQLGGILRQRPVDVFVHDSLHTYGNMRWEFEHAWSCLRPGGVLVSDDIQGNPAFMELKAKPISYWRVVRQEGKGALFGVLTKAPARSMP
jgi:predicted O-methyltransferase YrrM